MTSYYEVLGLDEEATVDEINTAYRKLAQRWHPDKNPEDLAEATRRFQAIGALLRRPA